MRHLQRFAYHRFLQGFFVHRNTLDLCFLHFQCSFDLPDVRHVIAKRCDESGKSVPYSVISGANFLYCIVHRKFVFLFSVHGTSQIYFVMFSSSILKPARRRQRAGGLSLSFLSRRGIKLLTVGSFLYYFISVLKSVKRKITNCI